MQEMNSPWLLVALFIFHDGEEVLFLPTWVQKNAVLFDELESKLPFLKRSLHLLRHHNQKQFNISVLLELAVLSFFSAAAVLFPQITWIRIAFISVLVLFTLHLVIHVVQSLFIHKVVPGTITSILVFLPSLILWKNQIQSAGITWGLSMFYGLIVAILFIPLFPVILKIGHWAASPTKKLE